LSDLGVQTGITAPLFNGGVIITGITAVVFATGFFKFLNETTVGRISAFIWASDIAALISIGIFPESVKPIHYYASVAFFVLFPLAMFTIAATFIRAHRVKLGLFTVIIALVAAAPWIVQFLSPYVSEVAIPETISALAASVWSIVLGFNMLKKVSQSHN
jgi:hypothetical membrane protein